MNREPSDQQAQPSEQEGGMDVGDDRLPEDLRPSEDNPLAQPADDDVPDDLLTQDGGQAHSGGGSEDVPRTGGGGSSEAPPSGTSSEAEPDGDEPGSDESTD